MMDYAIHILEISLWEWEGIKERNIKHIAREHPYQEACEAIESADKKIPELKKAIEVLKSQLNQQP